MQDIASLGIMVTSDGVVTASNRLNDLSKSSGQAEQSTGTLVSSLKALASAFAALEIVKAAQSAVMFAANVEQANVALGSIANSLGRTSAEAYKYRDSLRDIGITTNSATNATAQFMRAGLPVDALNKLGTAAQGAAISYQMMTGESISSSQALDKMVRALVTGNSVELHTLGINVQMRDILRENKAATGEAATAVDSHQRHILMLNEVLEKTGPLMDLYAASTALATKQISSSKRPVEELKLALGSLFLPELTAGATAFYSTVTDGMKWVRQHTEALSTAKGVISDFSQGLLYGVGALVAYQAAMGTATVLTGGFSTATAFLATQWGLTNVALTMGATSAASTSTSMVTMTTTTNAAAISVYSLRTAISLLASFMIGWEIGTFWSKFESGAKAGVVVVHTLVTAWDLAAEAAANFSAVAGNLTDFSAMKEQLKAVRKEYDGITSSREAAFDGSWDAAGKPVTDNKQKGYQDNEALMAAAQATQLLTEKKQSLDAFTRVHIETLSKETKGIAEANEKATAAQEAISKAQETGAVSDAQAWAESKNVEDARLKAINDVTGATKEGAKASTDAASQTAKDYIEVADKLLPLIKEQDFYDKALKVVNSTQFEHQYGLKNQKIALDNLTQSMPAYIEQQKQIAANNEWVKKTSSEYRDVLVASMSDEDQAIVAVKDKYRLRQAAILENATATQNFTLAAKESAIAARQEADEIERVKKSLEDSAAATKNNLAADMYKDLAGYDDEYRNTQLARIESVKQAEIDAGLDIVAAEKHANAEIAKLDQAAFDAKAKSVQGAIGDMSSAFSDIGSMYDKNSSEYAKMQEAAHAMIVLQKGVAVVNAVAAVAASAAAPWPAGFVSMAAMMASMGSLLGSIGVGMGGSTASTAPVTATGTGTTLGDSTKVSESTKNAYAELEKYNKLEYTELQGIHDSMKELNTNITGLVNSVVRGISLSSSMGGLPGSSGSFSDYFSKVSDGINSTLSFGLEGMTGKIVSFLSGNLIFTSTNAIVGTIMDGLFGGGTNYEYAGAGIKMDSVSVGQLAGGQQANVQNYATTKAIEDGGWFSSDTISYSTQYQKADDQVTKLFTDVFASMGKTLTTLTEGLGGDMSKALAETFSIPLVNLQGKTGDEIDKLINGVISAAGDAAVKNVLGTIVSVYQQAGEGLLETATRLFVGKEVVAETLRKTNQTMTGDLIATSQAMIDMAGGLDKLTESATKYYDAFFSDSEKQKNLYADLQTTMESIGQVMPATNEEFRKIVESLDLSTEAGKKSYVTMMSLSAEMDNYTASVKKTSDALSAAAADSSGLVIDISAKVKAFADAAASSANAVTTAQDNISEAYWSAQDAEASAQQKVNDLIKQSTDNLLAFAATIDTFLASIDPAKTTTGSTQSLKSQLMVTASAASAGDADAQKNLIAQAQAVLDSAKVSSSSAVDYARNVAFVRNQLVMVKDSVNQQGPATAAIDPMQAAQAELSTAHQKVIEYAAMALATGAETDRTTKIAADSVIGLTNAYNAAVQTNIISQSEYQEALAATVGIVSTSKTGLDDLTVSVEELKAANLAFIDALAASTTTTTGAGMNIAAALGLTGDSATKLAELLNNSGTSAMTLSAILGKSGTSAETLAGALGLSGLAAIQFEDKIKGAKDLASILAENLGLTGDAAKNLEDLLTKQGTATSTLSVILGYAKGYVSDFGDEIGTTKDAAIVLAEKLGLTGPAADDFIKKLNNNGDTVKELSDNFLIAKESAKSLADLLSVPGDASTALGKVFGLTEDQTVTLGSKLAGAGDISTTMGSDLTDAGSAATSLASILGDTGSALSNFTNAVNALQLAQATNTTSGQSASSEISVDYQILFGREADTAGAAYWANTGFTGNELFQAIRAGALGDDITAEHLRGFAVGTSFVPSDMTARIHKGEEITPRPYVDQQQKDRDATNGLLQELVRSNAELRKEIAAMRKSTESTANTLQIVTRGGRAIQTEAFV